MSPAVRHAHVHAVRVVSGAAEQALSAGNGYVGDDVVADLEPVLLALGRVERVQLSYELVSDYSRRRFVELAVMYVQIGAADSARDEADCDRIPPAARPRRTRAPRTACLPQHIPLLLLS